jgi:adenylate cyclase
VAPTRRLAAIMFTDIVGFTTLAQASEADAMRLLDQHNQLLRPFFARFHGREVKTMGDSFLVEFESALEATTCAVEIQRSLQGDHALSSGRERLRLRIGVHLGDVIASEGDVLGDAVNIASRIEPLAEPGGVCVSAQVYDQVRNKIDVGFEELAGRELKNVHVPITVYRLVLAPEPVPAGVQRGEHDILRRLAVLPFTNMSPDPQDDFFADGLTDEIITELSHNPSLRVIARTSVMRYKSAAKGVREIGAELRVGNVLEGSVRKASNQIRITVQLIDAATEEHLWAERFDRELADIFALQADIASSVAKALNLRFQPAAAPRLRPPKTAEAYTLYLRGRFLWNQRSTPSVEEARHRFEEAIAIDPGFALAYSGLADCYSILMDRGALPAQGTVPMARAAAERALALDPQLAEAHASLGMVYAHSADLPGAVREFGAAIDLNPGYAMAHHWLQLALLGLGRIEEAGREIAKAEESDPLSPIVLNSAGYFAWITGREDEALRKWDRTLELAPWADMTTFNRFALLTRSGRREPALQLLEAYETGPAEPLAKLWVRCCAHALLGDRDETERLLEQMRSAPGGASYAGFFSPLAFALLGDIDRAYRAQEGGTYFTGSTPALLRTSPLLAQFRADPRFDELVLRWELPAPRPPRNVS